MKTKQLFGYRFSMNLPFREKLLATYIESKEKEIKSAGHPEKLMDDMNYSEITTILLSKNVTHYYLCAPVINFSQKIKIKDHYQFQWLKQIPDQMAQYSFGNSLIRFQKKGSRIVAFFATNIVYGNGDHNTEFCSLNIDVFWNEINKPETEFGATSYTLLLQLLTFIELSEVEEITIEPGHKHGVQKSPDRLLNETPFQITIVNTRWAQKVYRPGEFIVMPHQRWQPMGPRSNPYWKVIWIDTYTKNGLTIQAGKDRRNS